MYSAIINNDVKLTTEITNMMLNMLKDSDDIDIDIQKAKVDMVQPKIHQTLLTKGVELSLKRVQRLMRHSGISSSIQKKYRPYASKKEKIEERENVLKQDFSTTTINEKWVADMTYIHVLREGWCYLASVLDLHSKKVIGYSFSRTMTTDLVVEALENAYSIRRPSIELILHTDLGSQYTRQVFQDLLAKHNIKPSFSRKGCLLTTPV